MPLLPPNAPLFSVTIAPCEDGAEGVEIYAYPVSVILIDDGRSVGVKIRVPHGPAAPGVVEDRFDYAELIAGEAVSPNDIAPDELPYVRPTPWSVEYLAEQPTEDRGLTVALRVPRAAGSVRMLLSQEEAMVTFRDALGIEMKSLTLFLNEDGSTLDGAEAVAA